jgi:hypothetical protein
MRLDLWRGPGLKTGIAVPMAPAITLGWIEPDHSSHAHSRGDRLLWRPHVGDCLILVVSSP